MTDDDGFRQFVAACDDLFTAVHTARGRIAEESGLTLSQTRMLEPLAVLPSLPVGELARHAGVAQPTASRMLQSLERNGMVVRHRGSYSERVVEVDLTPKGRQALAEQTERLRERQSRVYESIDPAERERAVAMVRTLIDLTWEMNGVEPPGREERP